MMMMLQSEDQSGKCAKLHTVAASNNREYCLTRSLIACLHLIQEYVCYSSRTSRSWWIAQATQHQPRSCNNARLSAWCLEHDLTLNRNQKPQLETSTRNLNPKPQPETSTWKLNLKPQLKPHTRNHNPKPQPKTSTKNLNPKPKHKT